jgi:hypothetical protein
MPGLIVTAAVREFSRRHQDLSVEVQSRSQISPGSTCCDLIHEYAAIAGALADNVTSE